MKVALSLHGQPRFYKEMWEQWKQYVEELNVDMYIHTWWGDDMVGELYPCAPHAKPRLSDTTLLVDDKLNDTIIELYKPKGFIYDSYNSSDFKDMSPVEYQFYTQWKSKELVRNSGINYDVVIRARFDVYVQVPIPITSIESNTIYTSTSTPYGDAPNDLLSVSDMETFFKISDTYLNISEFKPNVYYSKVESYLQQQIIKHNIINKTFYANYDYFDVVRDSTINRIRKNKHNLIL